MTIPHPDPSTIKTAQPGSSMAIATPFKEGVNHCLGVRQNLFQGGVTKSSGFSSAFVVETPWATNTKHCLVAIYASGIVQASAAVAVNVTGASATVLPVPTEGWYYGAVISGGTGFRQITVTPSACKVETVGFYCNPRRLSVTDLAVVASDSSFPSGGLYPEHFIYDGTNASIKDIQAAETSYRSEIKRTQWIWANDSGVAVEAKTSWTPFLGDSPIYVKGDDWRSTPTTTLLRVGIRGKVDPATWWQWRITIGGSTWTSAILVNTTYAWSYLETPTASNTDFSKATFEVITANAAGVVTIAGGLIAVK